MSNYRNYGNRRPLGNMDTCGCNKKEEKKETERDRMEKKQDMDCGCRERRMEPDCGCKEKRTESDCGCMERRTETDCDCRERRMESDCGCKEKKMEKDYGCKEEKRDCTIESMYREVKKNGACRECMEDMPGKALAMAYVPWQMWRKLYEVCEGFSTGTIFKELDLEFYGRRCN